ncbi:protein PBDC1 isoform X3 [Mesoplodon densirostris]|uniref:protein PBDC1 isoform X3 n=1 Tax=Mesoplodon densirostris TaxID=48708 RepID=UPI0028DBDEE1|nr:protein PBDC1 isoform X3 [Mesoplodon densirostris]
MEATSGNDEVVSGELSSLAHDVSLPAESYGNDPDIEMAWAMRAMQHAEVYYKLISSVDPQFLKLTKVDDQIYSEFRENFKKLRIDVLDPEELKSEAAKEHPGYNFLPLKLLGTGKVITKQFTLVFRTKKKRKEPTIEETEEPTVEEKRKEPTEKEKRRKSTKEEKKRKKPTKKSTKVVKQLCKVDREQHSRSCDSSEPTSTMMLLAQAPMVKCISLFTGRTCRRTSFWPNHQELQWLFSCMNWL